MTQQINLYDPALLRKHELGTLTNLVAVAAALLVMVGGWGLLARTQLAEAEAAGRSIAPQVKALQDQIAAIAKQASAVTPDPRLEAELATARAVLALRADVVSALKKSLGSEATSFAEYLRGFARQSVSGLWLTGFVIGDSGEMEIRGRMTDPAQLPEYIRRLNGEKAFQGRAFAALKVSAGQPTPIPDAAAGAPVTHPATGGASPGAVAKVAPYHEFTLTPVTGLTRSAGRQAQDAVDNPSPKLAAPSGDSMPGEVGRIVADVGRIAPEGKR